MASPRLLSIEERLQRLENKPNEPDQVRTAGNAPSVAAVKCVVPVDAAVGQAVSVIDGAWAKAHSEQTARALCGVVSRVIGSSPATCEVVVWGPRNAAGTVGAIYYLTAEATAGDTSTSPPEIPLEDGTEEFTCIVEVQMTPTQRFVCPDLWRIRVQRVDTCEPSEEDTSVPLQRMIAEVTNEGAEV